MGICNESKQFLWEKDSKISIARKYPTRKDK